ncbi:MAG TPA: molybdate ABC transporter substrate-binding protein [Xanthobacteraceae bacterium]
MRMVAAIATAAGISMLAFSPAGTADAAEIKALVSNALKSTMEEAAPQFEKASGNKLVITFGAAAELKASIEKGAAVDVAILTTATTDDLIKGGKLIAAGRADIARSGAGVAVRKGAPKPDISTTEAFKHALIDAKSIGFVGAGATAPYIRSLFDRLGIADQVQSKLKVLPATNPAANAVANGEAELGITQISEILPYAGAELVGPLPPEIQLYTVYPAAVATDTKESAAANALIKFLTAPAAIAVLKAKGLSPG